MNKFCHAVLNSAQRSPLYSLFYLILIGAILLGGSSGQAHAATYANAAATFSWINPATHTRAIWTSGASCSSGYAGAPVDDDITAQLPLGFTFNFGGVNYTQAQIMSNGRLQFNNGFCGFGTQTVGPPPTYPYPYPNANVVRAMRIYGADLDATPSGVAGACPTATCYVSYQALGSAPNRQFVVTWVNVPEWGASSRTGSFNLQIILNESGEFIYQFGTGSHPTGGSAQIGWELTTTDYDVWSTPVMPPANSAVRFFIPNPIAEFRMDESSWSGAGSVVNSTPSGINGSPIGAAQTVASGKLCRGGGIPSNTSTATIDAVNTGYDVDSQIGSSGTITFWYKSSVAWDGGGSQSSQLLDATVTNNRWFYLAKQNGNGRLSFNLTDNANNNFNVNTGNNSIAANTWVHVGVTWKLTPVAANNRLQIYVNGALAQSTAIGTTQPLSTAIGTLYAGDNRSGFTTNPGTGNSANGVIDELRIYSSEVTNAVILRDYNATRTCLAGLDHIRIDHAGTALTCSPQTVAITACANASCTSPHYSGGASVTLTPGGQVFLIDATGVNSAASAQQSTVGVATLDATSVPAESTATTCWNTATSTASCAMTFNDSGFIFDVPNHVSEVLQTVNVSAVKKSDSSLACTPAFASVSKNATFKCSYTNPATGTLPVRVNGTALNATNSTLAACDAGGRAVSLSFNASGVASTTFQYADVGNMSLTATYTGSGSDAGLIMTGSDTFIAAPASFAISGVTAAPIKAGSNFSATVTAKNSAGATTPNFGEETVAEGISLAFTKCHPTGIAAVNGSFSGAVGAFTNGVATSSTLNWSEVGNGDITATLSSGSYLGSGLTATGNTGTSGTVCNGAGNVGRFIPDHFDTVVTQGCSSGSFTYSAQPFSVQVNALNAAGAITQNYDGSLNTTPNFAKTTTLSDGNGALSGAFTNETIALSAFSAGLATATPSYTFTSALTSPTTIKLRATDTDAVISSTGTEGTTLVRSGRARLINAYGSELLDLPMPFTAQYWNGSAWALNSNDTCTTGVSLSLADVSATDGLTPAEVCIWDNGSPGNSGLGCSAAGVVAKRFNEPPAAGNFNLNFKAPGANNSGAVDVTATVPAWLQFNWTGSGNINPKARATFGVYKTPIIYMRENY